MGKKTRPVPCVVWLILVLLPLLYIAHFRPSASLLLEPWRNRISGDNHGGINSESIDNKVNETVSNDNIVDNTVSPSFPLRRLVRGRDRKELDSTGFSCDSDIHSDVCVIMEAVRIDTRTLTVYLSSNQTLPHMQRTVRPYARKEDNGAMQTVSPIELLRNANSPPECEVTHDVPAIIFSSAGFSDNLFHQFNEMIIPLFLTCYHFRSNLKFMITDFKPSWNSKYRQILTHLSNYDVINPADGKVHCFPEAVVGLKYHNHLAMNRTMIPGGYTMGDFKHFLRKSFSLKMKKEMEVPVLMLLSRRDSIVFLNEDDLVTMIKGVGFRVVVATPGQMSNMNKFAKQVSSCSVLVGAHGEGLTNAVFLTEGSVVIQAVPLGLDWPSTMYFGDPARKMGLHYLEYKVDPDESSLIDKYGKDDPVIRDPESIHKQGYTMTRTTYIDGQNLRLNLVRFRQTLVEALELLRTSNQ